MKILKFFVGFLIICAFTMFATANLQKVQVNFLFDDQPLLGYMEIENSNPDGTMTPERVPRQLPLFILIFGVFGVGFLVSWILSMGLLRKQRKNTKTLRKQCDSMNTELDELRNLPVNSHPTSKNNQLTDNTLPLE